MTENLSHTEACPKTKKPCVEFLACLARGLVEAGVHYPIECMCCKNKIFEFACLRGSPHERYVTLVDQPPPCSALSVSAEGRVYLTQYLCPDCCQQEENRLLLVGGKGISP